MIRLIHPPTLRVKGEVSGAEARRLGDAVLAGVRCALEGLEGKRTSMEEGAHGAKPLAPEPFIQGPGSPVQAI
jgi:hypothetical protein